MLRVAPAPDARSVRFAHRGRALALVHGVVLLLGPTVGGCAERPLEPRAPTPGAFHFTVQTFNVEYTDSNDAATIAAVGAADADVVCLQEVTPAWVEVLNSTYAERYPHRLFHVRGPTSTAGLAVLSRFPLTDEGIEAAPNGWHPAWHLRIATAVGPIEVLHVHLRAPMHGKGGAVRSLAEVDDDHLAEIRHFTRPLVEDVPTIVLGDFNEDVDGAAVGWLERRSYTNTLPLFHPGQGTWRYRSIAGQFDKAMDHILYGPGLDPLNAWVERRGHSDHLPVLAHFEISPN
jgi:endonuclease/exonuclease/phosphatase family metal-dependent hydrolase